MTPAATSAGDQVSGPLFSIVTPVYDTPPEALRAMIDSVLAQTCEDWELILVDDRSPDARVLPILRRAAAKDSRIRVVEREQNGHIVAASNDGIEAARGEFIALLDHDDLLVPRALHFMAAEIEGDPEVDYLYSDENKIDANGRFYDPFRKPVWSPERLRGQMYTSHFSVLRTSLVRQVGGFHEGFDGSQDHDLVLRVTELARKVAHIPRILYHWRVVPGSAAGDANAKPYAWVAGRKAVQAHLDRQGIAGTAEYGSVTGTYRIERTLDPGVRISVVIPTRGGVGLIWGERRCFVTEVVRSLQEHGGHANLEIVVVYDVSTPQATLDRLRAIGGPSLELVPYAKAFNFSEKCNLGVVSSYGDVVVLLNDDIEIKSPGFLVQLVAPLFEEGVGMTGAKLLYPDSTIQHAGLAFYRHHLNHLYYKLLGDDPGPFGALMVNRECSGLTGACVALRRSTYDRIGGMSEGLPINFNDVDFSFKVADAGLRLVWIANAVAYHFESQTRVPVVHEWESQFVSRRWRSPDRDRYAPDWGGWETHRPAGGAKKRAQQQRRARGRFQLRRKHRA